MAKRDDLVVNLRLTADATDVDLATQKVKSAIEGIAKQVHLVTIDADVSKLKSTIDGALNRYNDFAINIGANVKALESTIDNTLNSHFNAINYINFDADTKMLNKHLEKLLNEYFNTINYIQFDADVKKLDRTLLAAIKEWGLGVILLAFGVDQKKLSSDLQAFLGKLETGKIKGILNIDANLAPVKKSISEYMKQLRNTEKHKIDKETGEILKTIHESKYKIPVDIDTKLAKASIRKFIRELKDGKKAILGADVDFSNAKKSVNTFLSTLKAQEIFKTDKETGEILNQYQRAKAYIQVDGNTTLLNKTIIGYFRDLSAKKIKIDANLAPLKKTLSEFFKNLRTFKVGVGTGSTRARNVKVVSQKDTNIPSPKIVQTKGSDTKVVTDNANKITGKQQRVLTDPREIAEEYDRIVSNLFTAVSPKLSAKDREAWYKNSINPLYGMSDDEIRNRLGAVTDKDRSLRNVKPDDVFRQGVLNRFNRSMDELEQFQKLYGISPISNQRMFLGLLEANQGSELKIKEISDRVKNNLKLVSDIFTEDGLREYLKGKKNPATVLRGMIGTTVSGMENAFFHKGIGSPLLEMEKTRYGNLLNMYYNMLEETGRLEPKGRVQSLKKLINSTKNNDVRDVLQGQLTNALYRQAGLNLDILNMTGNESLGSWLTRQKAVMEAVKNDGDINSRSKELIGFTKAILDASKALGSKELGKAQENLRKNIIGNLDKNGSSGLINTLERLSSSYGDPRGASKLADEIKADLRKGSISGSDLADKLVRYAGLTGSQHPQTYDTFVKKFGFGTNGDYFNNGIYLNELINRDLLSNGFMDKYNTNISKQERLKALENIRGLVRQNADQSTILNQLNDYANKYGIANYDSRKGLAGNVGIKKSSANYRFLTEQGFFGTDDKLKLFDTDRLKGIESFLRDVKNGADTKMLLDNIKEYLAKGGTQSGLINSALKMQMGNIVKGSGNFNEFLPVMELHKQLFAPDKALSAYINSINSNDIIRPTAGSEIHTNLKALFDNARVQEHNNSLTSVVANYSSLRKQLNGAKLDAEKMWLESNKDINDPKFKQSFQKYIDMLDTYVRSASALGSMTLKGQQNTYARQLENLQDYSGPLAQFLKQRIDEIQARRDNYSSTFNAPSKPSYTAEMAKYKSDILSAGQDLNRAVASGASRSDIEAKTRALNDLIKAMIEFHRVNKEGNANIVNIGAESGLIRKLRDSLEKNTKARDILNEELRKYDSARALGNREIGRGRIGSSGGSSRRAGYANLGEWFDSMTPAGIIRGLGYALRSPGNALQEFGRVLSDLGKVGGPMATVINGAGTLAALFTGVGSSIYLLSQAFTMLSGTLQQVLMTIYQLLRPGIELHELEEKSQLSLAAAISGRATENGKDIPFERAEQIASDLVSRAFADAAMSAFSAPELISALQGTLPLAFTKGLNLEQAYGITRSVASAAKTIGLAPNQVLQETRDILQGTISSRSSQVASAAGLTSEVLRQAEAEGKLYEVIIEHLKSFTTALERYSGTLSGAVDRLKESWALAMMEVFKGIAPDVNALVNTLTEQLAGYYTDAQGNKLSSYGDIFDSAGNLREGVEKVLPEYIEPIKEVIIEIFEELVVWADQIIQFIQELTGSDDVINSVKDSILSIIAVVVTLGEILVTIIYRVKQAIDENTEIIGILINALVFFGGIIKSTINGVKNLTVALFDLGKAIWNVLNYIVHSVKAQIHEIKADFAFTKSGAKEERSFAAYERGQADQHLSAAVLNGTKAWKNISDEDTLFLLANLALGGSGTLAKALKSGANLAKIVGVGSGLSKYAYRSAELGLVGNLAGAYRGTQYARLGSRAAKGAGALAVGGKALYDADISVNNPYMDILKHIMPSGRGAFYNAWLSNRKEVEKRQSSGVDASSIVGKGVDSTGKDAKAAKQAAEQARKALQNHIEDLRAALKNHVQQLKDIQEQHDLAYQQGFESMIDYYTTKAETESEIAKARVQELEAEKSLIEALPVADERDQFQKQRDLIKVMRELNDATRELSRATMSRVDIQHQFAVFTNRTDITGTSNIADILGQQLTYSKYGTEDGSAPSSPFGGTGGPLKYMYYAANGCVEAVAKLTSSFSKFGDVLVERGIVNVESLVDALEEFGVVCEEVTDSTQFNSGDIIVRDWASDGLAGGPRGANHAEVIKAIKDGIVTLIGNHGQGITEEHEYSRNTSGKDYVFRLGNRADLFKSDVLSSIGSITGILPQAFTKAGLEVRNEISKWINDLLKTQADAYNGYDSNKFITISDALRQREANERIHTATNRYADLENKVRDIIGDIDDSDEQIKKLTEYYIEAYGIESRKKEVEEELTKIEEETRVLNEKLNELSKEEIEEKKKELVQRRRLAEAESREIDYLTSQAKTDAQFGLDILNSKDIFSRAENKRSVQSHIQNSLEAFNTDRRYKDYTARINAVDEAGRLSSVSPRYSIFNKYRGGLLDTSIASIYEDLVNNEQYIDMQRQALEAIKNGDRGLFNQAMQAMEAMESVVDNSIKSLLNDINSWFEARISIIQNDSGITPYVKEAKIKELNKVQAQSKAIAYRKKADWLNIKGENIRGDISTIVANPEGENGKLSDAQAEQVAFLEALSGQIELQRSATELQVRSNELLAEQKTYWQESIDALNASLERNLESFFLDLGKGTSFKDAFGNMMLAIAQDMQKKFAHDMATGIMSLITGNPIDAEVLPEDQIVANEIQESNIILRSIEANTSRLGGSTGTTTVQSNNGGKESPTSSSSSGGSSSGSGTSSSAVPANGGLGNIMGGIQDVIGNEFVQLAGTFTALSSLFKGDTKEKLLSMIFLEVQLMLTYIMQIATAVNGLGKGLGIKGFAEGGIISGPGTGTSDSIPAMLSNGEGIITASRVRQLGSGFINAVNNGEFSKIRAYLPHYADGGIAGATGAEATARGMSEFAKTVGTNVSTTNNMNIALVRDEQEAMAHFMRSGKGQRIMADFTKKNARLTSMI